MESTRVYWKPIFNILEADFEVILVNAKHIKNVTPGEKEAYSRIGRPLPGHHLSRH
jgi:transposase